MYKETWRRVVLSEKDTIAVEVHPTGQKTEPTGVVSVSIEALHEFLTELGYERVDAP